MITLLKVVRLDDRLVHGQLFNNWCTYENITEIIVVNEEISHNEIRKTFIEMSAPEGINIIFCDIYKVLEIYEEECKYENVIMIFGNPFEILEFIENGGKVESINIGGMSYRKDKKKISTAVYADESELQAFKKIAGYGIELEIRILPTDKRINLLKYI